jgi:hypothetical protein
MHLPHASTRALPRAEDLRRRAHELAEHLPDRDAWTGTLSPRRGTSRLAWADGLPWETLAAFGLGLAVGAGFAALAMASRRPGRPPAGPFDPSV